MNKVFEVGVLRFGGENEVVEKVYNFRNKVYLLFRCYLIILNIKFIILYIHLEISNNYQSYIYPIIYIYIYIYKSNENSLNSRKLHLR